MKKILFILTFLFFYQSFAFSKGCSGSYFINGFAYNAQKELLTNKIIIVKIGNVTDTIFTDTKGFYEIEIKWRNACPSGVSKSEHSNLNKKINPDFIHIGYQGIIIRLNNEWEKYAECFPENKKSITRKVRLNFSIY